MPEGPEVETIRRGLELGIAGQKIAAVHGMSDEIVVGTRVRGLARRAKVLLIELDNDFTLMVHLKMTGQLVLARPALIGNITVSA